MPVFFTKVAPPPAPPSCTISVTCELKKIMFSLKHDISVMVKAMEKTKTGSESFKSYQSYFMPISRESCNWRIK